MKRTLYDFARPPVTFDRLSESTQWLLIALAAIGMLPIGLGLIYAMVYGIVWFDQLWRAW